MVVGEGDQVKKKRTTRQLLLFSAANSAEWSSDKRRKGEKGSKRDGGEAKHSREHAHTAVWRRCATVAGPFL